MPNTKATQADYEFDIAVGHFKAAYPNESVCPLFLGSPDPRPEAFAVQRTYVLMLINGVEQLQEVARLEMNKRNEQIVNLEARLRELYQ